MLRLVTLGKELWGGGPGWLLLPWPHLGLRVQAGGRVDWWRETPEMALGISTLSSSLSMSGCGWKQTVITRTGLPWNKRWNSKRTKNVKQQLAGRERIRNHINVPTDHSWVTCPHRLGEGIRKASGRPNLTLFRENLPSALPESLPFTSVEWETLVSPSHSAHLEFSVLSQIPGQKKTHSPLMPTASNPAGSHPALQPPWVRQQMLKDMKDVGLLEP